MKRIKKLASLLLALAMVFAMTITSFATEGDVTDPSTGAGEGGNTESQPSTNPTGNDSGYTINIRSKTTGHVYQAYQVFDGEITNIAQEGQNPEYKLSNIRWAGGVDTTSEVEGKTLMVALREKFSWGENVQNAAQVAEKLSETTFTAANAEAFADVISKYLGTPVTGTFTQGTQDSQGYYPYTMTVSAAGYYFVRDSVDPNGTDSNPTGNASYTDYILEVVGPVSVIAKDTTVEIEKDILDPDPVKGNTAGIGDDVTYRLTSKVPNYKAYDYYYFIMQDTLSNGLDFNNDVVVQIGTITETTDASGNVVETFTSEKELVRTGDNPDYRVYVGANDTLLASGETTNEKTFKIAFNDIKTLLGEEYIGKDIVVTYSAKINSNAVVGTSEPNEVHLIYSNDPNNSGRGDVDGKPGLPDSTKNIPTGETPKSIVVTFVADVTIYKTAAGTPPTALAGAEFTLTGYSTQTVLKGGEVYTPSADGTFYQLKDGSYTENAPQEVATMQALPAGATAGYVVAEADYSGTDAVTVGGTTYRPYKAGDSGTVYILIEPNTGNYASVTAKFTKETASKTETTTKFVRAVGTSDSTGKVSFMTWNDNTKAYDIPLKLGDGTYTITETRTPAGYNTADPITVVIKGTPDISGAVTGNETCTWSFNGSSISNITLTNTSQVTGNISSPSEDEKGGVYWMNIENKSGSLLPSTGGIGTTIFYVVGGILVIGAGILLVAKKRMSNR